MDCILVGPGRAGLSLATRLVDSNHRVVGVLGRGDASDAATRLGATVLSWDEDLPEADLLVVAVRDDAIVEVAERLRGRCEVVSGAVHLSGLTPVVALEATGVAALGSFHPLQTLPTPEAGAARLAGSWVGITSDDDLFADRLFSLAHSLGMHPFELTDDAKPLYHAAAASAANYPLAALVMSEALFQAAGVPFEAAAPLVAAVVANAMELGPRSALTGPIARGDAGTVAAQLAAVRAAAPEWAEHFAAMGRATAAAAGTGDVVDEALR